MKEKNPDDIRIGESIRRQIEIERGNRGQQRAAARFDVDTTDPEGHKITHVWLASQVYKPTHTIQIDIKGNFRGTTGQTIYDQKEEASRYVSKNSSLGIILTSKPFGSYKYIARDKYRTNQLIEREVTFTSKATFHNGQPVRDIAISLPGRPISRYVSLDDLLKQPDEITRKIEEKQHRQQQREKEALRIKAELEAREAEISRAKAIEAERLRLEAEKLAEEQRRKDEERKRDEKEIRRLEEERKQAEDAISAINESYRSGIEMRYQEITDEYQTKAKISHLYDGTTLVIDGGPGTGKTTTSIGRLKFLIDPCLIEHESCPLTEDQIDRLTDSGRVRNNWIFISPSDLLAQYLRSALSAEGLANDIANVIPYHKFLSNNLWEYNITSSPSGKKAPFVKLRNDDPHNQRILIKDGKLAVEEFSDFMRAQISKPFLKAAMLKTSGFEWHQCALGIQIFCRQMERAKSFIEITRILQNLQLNDQERVKGLTDKMNDAISILANRVKRKVLADEDTRMMISILFEDWERAKDQPDDGEEMDLSEDEDIGPDLESLDGKIFDRLKKVIRNLGIKNHDSSFSLNKKNGEFYEIVKPFIDAEDMDEVASLAWFNRNFGSLCRGPEAKIVNPVLNIYKSFRREQLKKDFSPYDKDLLKELITSSNNRYLHRDEQSLILGFINTLLNDFMKHYPLLFKSFRHPFVQAYNRSVKHVIGVDEASDYSELDYWCIKSFSHPDFSAITLCGDIMQGLGNNGIGSWDELRRWVFPNLDVFTLKTSYRQWPALLEVSQRMYMDDQGHEAPFKCYDLSKPMAKALAYVSKSEEEKIEWLAEQIDHVYNIFSRSGNGFPSVAVFINKNENAASFVESLRNTERLMSYDIDDCTNDKQGRPDTIRVFHLSKVKGLEFEAAFFHNIDGLQMTDNKLLRRLLYVGISRAVSHLGATFSDPSSDLLKYFETNGSWKIK